ncbi:MAG: hypothetical protein JWN41_698 [Thermoleophilia bacterium]|nr:hypothetical protein [Thermoleophilia bacterium]
MHVITPVALGRATSSAKSLFPKWSAETALTGMHGQAAYTHVVDAVHSANASDRLDASLRAYTSFDHALDNARKLPLTWAIRNIDSYLDGYDVARMVMLQLANADVVPGAREHIGSQTMHAGRGSFGRAIDARQSDPTKYGNYLAAGWLEAAAEDAANGAALLRTSSNVGTQLLAGIHQVQLAVAHSAPLDAALVQQVGELFAQADTELANLAEKASHAGLAVDPAKQQAAMASTSALLNRYLANA